MHIEFPLILGAGYSCGDAEETIQIIRNTLAVAVEAGYKLKLFEDKGLVLGAYYQNPKSNKSIIEVVSDGGVNLYGLMEFIFKDMMLFDLYKEKMFVNDSPKPFLSYNDFDRFFEIDSWLYDNGGEFHVETGKLILRNEELKQEILVVDAFYSNNIPPKIVDELVEFIKEYFLKN